ncbi:hypothetical protein Ae201684P_013115 [Aphanomyces euteiches]|nr:hypothetical protein Ae201684P_013115 [Aphanomyces euteiches]KAH9141181.1 hypothetical protein AeRB84_014642 [Aphanomyces euteiches]
MQLLCLAVGRHIELVAHEIQSIASLYGEPILHMEDPVQVGRFFFVDFRTEVAAKCIVSRCVLLQACFRIVDDMQLGTMNMLAKYFLKTYPDCFLPGKADNLVDVKALNKRLRIPKEREALIGQFTRLDIEAFCKVHNSIDQVSLLVGKNMCCMGFLVAQGLSPSSGSCNGRVGGGIAAKFSLRDRPYTGVTTMDPELALVMANAARVKKRDIVLDPFAGSCGVLLACSYFGMGMGFAQDISQSTLRGEGPGRDIAANFDAFHFYRPEIALADVTNPMWRKTWEIDAIVCDPPYGVRTFGSHTDEIFGFDDQYISELIVKWSPYLVKGGRIVFYACGLPNHYEILKSYLNNLTCAYNLEVVSIIESVVHLENTESNTKWSRSLVTLEKTGAFISIPLHELKTIKVHQSSSRQKPWNIERNMDPFDVWRAAWLGDLSSIKEYASRGGDLNLQDVAGKTALFFAAGYNQLETVKFLATKVPIDTMDIQGMTPLFQAARHGNPEIMEVLLSLGADPCTMNSKRLFPAYYAATYGHSEVR